MTRHRDLAVHVAEELAARADVLAVLIGGSVGRGEHVQSSDIDLVVVADEGFSLEPAPRIMRDGLLVEWIAKTEPEWLARFDRPKTSWLYPFLEGEVFFDSGPAARLADQARQTLRTYQTPPELRSELATLFWHGQAKLDRALASTNAQTQGFWASVLVPSILDALYAVRNVPLPAGARRLEYLSRLDLPDGDAELLRQTLTDSPSRRLQAAATLVAILRQQLGPADHEEHSE